MSEYVLSVHAFCSALTDDQLVIIVDEIQAQANARPFCLHKEYQFSRGLPSIRTCIKPRYDRLHHNYAF